ncbi:MAG: hypothetical protein KF852_19095 [Saprospiraceae bacterium]|nr:hypothetical protein [Saprospiraceae bacterium]
MKISTLYAVQLWLLLSLVAAFSPHAATAQSDTTTYNYAAFRFPDINRRALDFSMDVAGSANASETRGTFPISLSSGNFSQNLSASYGQFINNERLQALRSVSLFQGFSDRSQETIIQNTPNNFFWQQEARLSVSSSGENRLYRSPLRYLEANWLVSVQYNFLQRRQNGPNPAIKSEMTRTALKMPLRIGVGRIEPVDDVFLAKFMVDDMQQNGILAAPLSESDLFALGQVMAHARNQRNFDFRRQRIYELTQLNNWFKEKGITDSGDLMFFTTLADNWLYGFSNVRSSGQRFSVGIEPFYQYISQATYRATASVRYEGRRPINQYWQLGHTLDISTAYGVINSPFPQNPATRYWQPGATALFLAGWFPNSRTRINGSTSLQANYFMPQSSSDFIWIAQRTDLAADYFLNFRTRLRANIGLQYNWSSSTSEFAFIPLENAFANNKEFFLNGGLSLFYSLF